MFSITAKFKEHSIKFRILVIVLPVVILSYIILLSSFYMIYVKESRNNILLEHEKNTLSIAKNTASYFSSLNSNIDLLLYGTWLYDRQSDFEKLRDPSGSVHPRRLIYLVVHSLKGS